MRRLASLDRSFLASRFLVLGGVLLLGLACESGPEDATATGGERDLSAEEVRAEIDDAVTAVKDYTFENKEEFEAWARKRLASLDDRLAALEERGEELGDQTGDDWRRTVEELRTRRRRLDAQLDKLRGSSADAWDELQKGFREGRRELVKAIDAAADHFEGDE